MRTDDKFLLLPPLTGRRRKFDPKPNRSRLAVASPGFLTTSFNASASFDAQTERAGLRMCLTVREPTVGWRTLFIYLFICLLFARSFVCSFRLPSRPSVRPSVHPSLHPSIHPSKRPFIHPSVGSSIRSSVCQSVRPFIQSVRPSIYSFILLFAQ